MEYKLKKYQRHPTEKKNKTKTKKQKQFCLNVLMLQGNMFFSSVFPGRSVDFYRRL